MSRCIMSEMIRSLAPLLFWNKTRVLPLTYLSTRGFALEKDTSALSGKVDDECRLHIFTDDESPLL